MSETGELDVTAGPTGVGVRTKGYRLMDMVCLASAFGVGYICLMVYNHDASAAKENMAVVQAVKENTNVIRQQVKAQHVANCLNSLLPEQKKDSRWLEFCKGLEKNGL